MDNVCIFCLTHRGNVKETCSYGFKHEFPADVVLPTKQVAKPDKKLCKRCGLHPKNPKFCSVGCEHEFDKE